jgi:beta-glucosidase-like glycosyl hydrolase/CubicO group peptidase (beta-lactamase class C family)
MKMIPGPRSLPIVAALICLAPFAPDPPDRTASGGPGEAAVRMRTVAPIGTQSAPWVDSLLASLTLEEKVGQLFVVPATGKLYNENDPEYVRLVDLVERFEIGGIIFFRGEPLAQALLTNDLQARSDVPLLISQDMEWGAGMRLRNTTDFPRAMALGATRDPDLAYAMGRVVAAEARSLGVHVNYAPVADINNDPDNPVINVRSYGEDPDLVATMASAYTRGLQDGGLIATAKHFPGHGDTNVDSHSGLPVLRITRARLDSLELVPFARSIEDGVGAIMIAHIALPQLEGKEGIPATLSPSVVSQVLRRDLGFDGMIVTDAMNMHGITDHFGSGEAAVLSLAAGVDQILMSNDFYAARRAVLRAVETGRLPLERVDAAVRRVLEAKVRAGLTARQPANIESIRTSVSAPEAEALAHEIARRSLTLLSNDGKLIPVTEPDVRILSITISDSDDPSRGRTLDRLLRRHLPESRVDRVLLDRRSHSSEFGDALKRAADYDVALVQSHVIVRTGSGRIGLDQLQRDFLDDLVRNPTPVLLVAFGNPYVTLGLGPPDAFVAAYSSSYASITAVADALTGRSGFEGRLPVRLPGQYPIGSGLESAPRSLRYGRPEQAGMSSQILARLDTLLWHAIEDSAFPGAAFAIGRSGIVARSGGVGYFTYESEQKITSESVFDLASLTKVVATTPAIMLLYERGQIELDAPLATYLPEFGEAGKQGVTVRQVLTHTSGLPAFYPFEHMGVNSIADVLEFIRSDTLRYEPDSAYRYSDIGMMLLALAVERITDKPFETFLRENVYEPLGMHRTRFRPAGGAGTDTTIVPTEVDTILRKGLVQGEVHDERAWIVGGTAGHAGLFSTANDLARYASMLLNGGVGNGGRIFQPETVELFTTRFENALGHTRALGWDTRRAENSSAGSFAGPKTFGHTGFTGTSLWIDPDADLFVILLTNRVYPSRASLGISVVRPKVADTAFLAVTGPARMNLSIFEKEPF